MCSFFWQSALPHCGPITVPPKFDNSAGTSYYNPVDLFLPDNAFNHNHSFAYVITTNVNSNISSYMYQCVNSEGILSIFYTISALNRHVTSFRK